MDIDKHCNDGMLFDVIYCGPSGTQIVRKFLFSIEDTEETVKEMLTAAPYYMDVKEVIESSYILSLRDSQVPLQSVGQVEGN